MNELTKQDLMVGDWVYRVDFKEHIPVRILGLEIVNYDTQPKQYVADVFCPKHNNNVGLYMDEICPIHLTSEILKKNGFQQISTNKYVSGKVTIAVFAEEFLITIKSENARVMIAIKYVHELQRVLRLCSINKEIKL